MKKPVHNPREVAEIVAIQALSFIAGEPERLGLFLAETGVGPETLRNAAADPKFLADMTTAQIDTYHIGADEVVQRFNAMINQPPGVVDLMGKYIKAGE